MGRTTTEAAHAERCLGMNAASDLMVVSSSFLRKSNVKSKKKARKHCSLTLQAIVRKQAEDFVEFEYLCDPATTVYKPLLTNLG